VTRAVRIALIVVLMLGALSFLVAGHEWELAHPRSSPTRGAGYELAMLAMVVITIAALLRRRGR